MPGHLGGVNRTIQNLTIVKILPDDNVILVKGSIPGHKGSIVVIKPTQKKYTLKEILTDKKDTPQSEEIAKSDIDSKQDDKSVVEAKTDNTSSENTKESANDIQETTKESKE